MKAPEIYVAGLGVISALGHDLPSNRHALESGVSGIGPITSLETVHRDTFSVGEVKFSNEALAASSGLSSSFSRTALLSCIAAKEACLDAGVNTDAGLKVGFVSATSVGGMDLTENFYNEFLPDHQKGRLRDVVHHECGSVTEIV